MPKLSRAGSIVVNTVTNYARFGIMFLVFALVTPRMIQGVGQSAYGIWILVFAVTGFFGLFDLGFGTASVRFIARNRARSKSSKDLLLGRLLVTYIILSALSLLAASIIDPLLGGILNLSGSDLSEGKILFRLLVLRTAVLYLPLSLFRHILYGYQYIWFVNLVQALTAAVYGLGTLVIIDSGGGIIHLGILNLGTMILEHLVYLIAVFLSDRSLNLWRILKSGLSILKKNPASAIMDGNAGEKHSMEDGFKEVFSLSIYSFIINLAVLIQMRSDPLIINILVDKPLQAVAVYAVAMKISEYYLLMIKQFSSVLSPLVAELDGQGDLARIRFLLVAGTKYAYLPAIIAGGFLLSSARMMIVAWAGPEFAAAAPALILTVFAILASVPEMIGSTILNMTGKHRFAGRVALLGMLLNIFFTSIFVYFFGITGAALGTLIACIIVDWFIIMPRVLSIYKIRVHSFLKVIVPAVLIPGGLDYALTLLLARRWGSGLGGLALSAIPGAVLGLGVFLLFFVDKREKDIILKRKPSKEKVSPSPGGDPVSTLSGTQTMASKEACPEPVQSSECLITSSTATEVETSKMHVVNSGQRLSDEDLNPGLPVYRSDPFFSLQYQENCRRHVLHLPSSVLIMNRRNSGTGRNEGSGFCVLFEHSMEKRGVLSLPILKTIDFNATSIRMFDDPVEGKAALALLIDGVAKQGKASGALVVRMHKVSNTSACCFTEALDSYSIPYTKTWFNTNYHIALPENLDGYWKRKSPKAMYNIRRSQRLLETWLGEPCRYLLLPPESLIEIKEQEYHWLELFLNILEQVALTRAEPEKEYGVSGAFYRSTILSWAETGRLELNLLVSGEHIIAGQASLRRAGRITVAIMGFDERYAKFSPGKILLAAFINDVHARGIRLVELGGEGDSWKREWANLEEPTWSISFPISRIMFVPWVLAVWLKKTTSVFFRHSTSSQ